MASLVVDARPAPHVFVVVLRFALVEDSRTYSPHDDAEDEETDGEDSVVCSYFFGSIMPSSAVGNHNNDRHEKRDTGDDQEEDLRPCLGVLSPRRKVVSLGKRLCCVENSECGCQHGEDDETAGEVDTTKEYLCDPHSDLDFLLLVSFIIQKSCWLNLQYP